MYTIYHLKGIIMSMFAGAGNAKASGGVYFKPGKYVVELGKLSQGTARDRIDFAAIEARVIDNDGNPSATSEGTTAAQILKMRGDILDTVLGNLKAFAGACLGIADVNNYVPEDGEDPEEFWVKTLEFLFGPKQPMAGKRIQLNCVNKPTKKGNDFTLHQWGPLLSDEDED